MLWQRRFINVIIKLKLNSINYYIIHIINEEECMVMLIASRTFDLNICIYKESTYFGPLDIKKKYILWYGGGTLSSVKANKIDLVFPCYGFPNTQGLCYLWGNGKHRPPLLLLNTHICHLGPLTTFILSYSPRVGRFPLSYSQNCFVKWNLQ